MIGQLLKVAVHQPAIPSYRVPVFAKLNSEFETTVFFGAEKALSNVRTDSFPSETTKFTRFEFWKIGNMIWDWTQLKLCGDPNWDVVVVPWNTRYLSLAPSLVRAKFNGIPVILWGHGYSKRSGFLRDKIRDLITGLASAVMFYDPNSRDAFCKRTGRTNAFCAPNAIDQTPIAKETRAWRSSKGKLESFKAKNNLQNRKIVLYVSRIEPQNRLDLLIDAVHIAKQKDPNLLLVIIGKGSDEELTTMKRRVAELDCNHHVRFLGPIYDEHELAPWFLSSFAYCYPSNVGLSLIHAFGYGMPVLLGDDFTKCNPEIYAFEPGKNGLTFQDENAADLATQVLKLVNDDSLRQMLSAGALHTATEVATLDNMVEGFSEAIRFAGSKSRSKRTKKQLSPKVDR